MGELIVMDVIRDFFEKYHDKFHYATRYVPLDDDEKYLYKIAFDRCRSPKKLNLAVKQVMMNADWQNQVKLKEILKIYRDDGGRVSPKKERKETKKEKSTDQTDFDRQAAERDETKRMQDIFDGLRENQQSKIVEETKQRLLNSENPMLRAIIRAGTPPDWPVLAGTFNRETLWTTAKQMGDEAYLKLYPRSFGEIAFERATGQKNGQDTGSDSSD